MQPKAAWSLSVISSLSALTVIVLAAPRAHADAADDDFLGMATAQDIPDPARFVAEARAACGTYGTPGYTPQLVGLAARGLSSTQATNVLADGVAAYCPDKLPPQSSWPPVITPRQVPWP